MRAGTMTVKDLFVVLADKVANGGGDTLVWFDAGPGPVIPVVSCRTVLAGGENYSPMRWDFLLCAPGAAPEEEAGEEEPGK